MMLHKDEVEQQCRSLQVDRKIKFFGGFSTW